MVRLLSPTAVSAISRFVHGRLRSGLFFRRLTVFLFLSTTLPALSLASPAAIIPDRDVVISDTSKEPEWKILWDKARELARQENYAESAGAYSELLRLKPNIEEATWEYCLVLITLADWDHASPLLEDLLEKGGSRLDYLFRAGFVALKKKEYARAAGYYELLYQQKDSLGGSQKTEALTGLVAALRGQGKNGAAYPFMEQLLEASPDDSALLHQLAADSVRHGYREKAVLYYQRLISRPSVDDRILREAAVFFEESGHTALAVLCWEQYVRRHPDYLPFHEKLANHFLAHGEKETALPHLLVLLGQGPNDAERLLQVGGIYLSELGRPDKALGYYEKYLQAHPGNQDVAREIAGMQATLAQDLTVRVKKDGALPLWKELAQVTPNRLAIYASMAQLLEGRGNSQELREVLAIMHKSDPGNPEVVLRLAELFLELKEYAQVEHYLALVPPDVCQNARFLLISADLAEQRGLLRQALDGYGLALEMTPGDQTVRAHCLTLSARLGLIDRYQLYYEQASQAEQVGRQQVQRDLDYARVLLTGGLASRARAVLEKVLADGQEKESELTVEIRHTLADALNMEGEPYEAEQVLRQMLADGVAVTSTLYKLVENSLENNELELAGVWLSFFAEQPGVVMNAETCAGGDNGLLPLQVRFLVASGKTGQAVERTQEYRAVLARSCPGNLALRHQADLLLGEVYLQGKQYGKGQDLVAELLADHPSELELLVLGRRFDVGAAAQSWQDKINEALGGNPHAGFDGLMRAARLERKYGDIESAFQYVHLALKEVPESMSARDLLADLLLDKGNLEAAGSFLQSLVAEFPEELRFTRRLLQTEFKLASFDRIIEKLVPSTRQGLGKGILPFPDTGHLTEWQKLILARSLWADRQWVAAVAVYDTLLQPSVEMLFLEKMEEQQVQLVLPPPRQSLWNMLTFTHPAEPDRLTRVMEPAFLMSQQGQPGGRLGADLYAGYRRQQMVATELSARRGLAQGDYYQAMKEYQEIVEHDSSPESLFDLAGIYSRLGLLGKEALLYEEIERDNPDYPELAESQRRNSLKRQPRGMIDMGYSSLSGRNGYLDLQQTRGGAGIWMLPTLRQEMDVSWSTLHVIADETDQSLWRNRFLTAYSFYPHTNVDFVTKVGFDKPDEEHDHAHYDVTPLYHFEMRGRIGDELHGSLTLRQDVVDDTVEALEQGVSKRDLEGGVRLDLLPRLFCGGEYLFREYSDANHQNRYHVWASYVLNSEPLLLQVTYGQELLHNAEGNMGRDFTYANGFAPGDHPYWSPKEYWQNSIAVHFKHQLAADVLGRSAPSYYTLDYAFGYEDGGYDSHTFGGNIFLEMSRHFLLSSSFDLIQGGPVIRKDIAVSLVYRW